MEAHALHERGWTISAIARHLGRDRKTVRAYLTGERVAGVRARTAADPLALYRDYLKARFVDDPHVWASCLHDELVPLGYAQSYPTFVRQLRLAGLRPHCEACAGVRGRDTIEIAHPPGEEIQWDWFERRRAPFGGTAYVLLGTLSHSGRVRGVICESMDQAQLIFAIDEVLRRLGGTARIWRTDRLASVIVPGTAEVQASFAPVAKHYRAVVEPCPPRRGNRKGVVESAVRFVSGRWWRTLSATTREEAQQSLDRFCATTGDARERRREDGTRTSVGTLGDAEPLRPLPPVPYPATLEVARVVAQNATVSYRGNRYATPPGLSGTTVLVRQRLGTDTIEVHAPSGALLVAHRRAPDGAGALVRSAELHRALEKAVLSAFSAARPCDKKANRPPGAAAKAAAAALLSGAPSEVTVDLSIYEQIAGRAR